MVLLKLLEKLDIPLIYYRTFGIFKTVGDTVELVSYRFRVREWYDPDARYDLLVATLPYNVRTDELDPNFQEFVYHQISGYLLSEEWPIASKQYDLLFNLAAYRCAIDFGPFDPQKHQKGFLANVIDNLVPRSIRKRYSYGKIESSIFASWKFHTAQGLNGDRQLCILNYLGLCEEFVPQFGCFVINASMNSRASVRLGMRQDGIVATKSDGKILFQARYNQMTYNETNERNVMSIYCRGECVVFQTTAFLDVLKLRLFIERCVYPQEGYFDTEVAVLMEKIKEEKKKIDSEFERSCGKHSPRIRGGEPKFGDHFDPVLQLNVGGSQTVEQTNQIYQIREEVQKQIEKIDQRLNEVENKQDTLNGSKVGEDKNTTEQLAVDGHSPEEHQQEELPGTKQLQ